MVFPYGILSMAHVGCPDPGNAIFRNDARPHRTVECTLTGIHCGTFHTAFDAPSHLPPFSSSSKFCRLERMLGQIGFRCGVFL